MNCRQARSFFSARIDGELSALEDRELQLHLDRCPNGCPERWASFEATVRLVHGLPVIEPDPSFVGQVLDRVRGYEAERLRPRFVPRPSLRARLRAFIPEWMTAVPMAARFASAGVGGLALGFFLASGIGWRPFHAPAPAVVSSGREAVSASEERSPAPPTALATQPPRLFGDLIDDLDVTRDGRAREDTVTPPQHRVLPDGAPSVHVVKGDERPQIIF